MFHRCSIGLETGLAMEESKPILFKPSSDSLALMLWVIVLLKDNAKGVFAIKINAFLKLIIQDLGIKHLIHPSINLTYLNILTMLFMCLI